MSNMNVLRNIIRYSDWRPRPANVEGGIYYSDIQNAVFANNLVCLGTTRSLQIRACPLGLVVPPTTREQCSPYPPLQIPGQGLLPCLDTVPSGYRRVWLN